MWIGKGAVRMYATTYEGERGSEMRVIIFLWHHHFEFAWGKWTK